MLKFACSSSISFLLSPNANEILERFRLMRRAEHRVRQTATGLPPKMRRIVFVNGRIPLGAPSEWRTGLRRRNSPGGKIVEHMFLRVLGFKDAVKSAEFVPLATHFAFQRVRKRARARLPRATRSHVVRLTLAALDRQFPPRVRAASRQEYLSTSVA